MTPPWSFYGRTEELGNLLARMRQQTRLATRLSTLEGFAFERMVRARRTLSALALAAAVFSDRLPVGRDRAAACRRWRTRTTAERRPRRTLACRRRARAGRRRRVRVARRRRTGRTHRVPPRLRAFAGRTLSSRVLVGPLRLGFGDRNPASTRPAIANYSGPIENPMLAVCGRRLVFHPNGHFPGATPKKTATSDLVAAVLSADCSLAADSPHSRCACRVPRVGVVQPTPPKRGRARAEIDDYRSCERLLEQAPPRSGLGRDRLDRVER